MQNFEHRTFLYEVCLDDQHPSLCSQTMNFSISKLLNTISIVVSIVYVMSQYNYVYVTIYISIYCGNTTVCTMF